MILELRPLFQLLVKRINLTHWVTEQGKAELHEAQELRPKHECELAAGFWGPQLQRHRK